MSVQLPAVPFRYAKRPNNFEGDPASASGSGSGGSPLNVEDEGEPVPASPTNTLNFVGAAVRARYSQGKIHISVASRFEEDGTPAPPGSGTAIFEHPELDGLEWEDSGHTGGERTIAGFDGSGAAKEWPTAKLEAEPHAVVLTDATGRIAYALTPGPALEYNVIGLSLMLG